MRFLIQAVNISGTEHEKEMVRALRKICRESPLNASVFHPYFVFFDQVKVYIHIYFLPPVINVLLQFELVRPVSIQNMILGAMTMMVVSFIFIPNVLCSIWVAFSIISIEAGVVGYMALWNVNLDSISMINLIMCIGFSVDFTAHICYAYMSSKAKRPDERVKECLYALGLPIFQGSISTILGMLALLLADNYIFSVFFKMVFLVVFFGAVHGMFLLPVLLSLFGPGSCTNFDKEDELKMSAVEKSLPHPYCIPHPQFTLNGNSHLNSNLKHMSTIEKLGKSYKMYDVEKDLGLGTSEENSSESSSNSNKKQIAEEELIERRYRELWRRNSDLSPSQFHVSHVLDIYGTSDRDYRHRIGDDHRMRRFYDSLRPAESPPERYTRQYSPPEQRYHGRQLVRSNSYHNLQHNRYVQELRFP